MKTGELFFVKFSVTFTARSTTGKMKSFPISGRHRDALLACHGDASGTVAIFVPFVTPSLSIYDCISQYIEASNKPLLDRSRLKVSNLVVLVLQDDFWRLKKGYSTQLYCMWPNGRMADVAHGGVRSRPWWYNHLGCIKKCRK